MQELLDALPRKSLGEVNNIVFADTCFIIDELHHHKAEELDNVAILSFNAEELVHVARHLPSDQKKGVRQFLKNHNPTIIQISVSPGDWNQEKHFVSSIDRKLLEIIPDASDAVLLAAALKSRSFVLTKDKHHLFTVTLENYLQEFGIRVFKEMKDYLLWKQG